MPVGANVRLQFQAPVSHRSFTPSFTPQFHAPVSGGTKKKQPFHALQKKTHPHVATLHIPHTAGQTHALNSHALELRWSSWTAVEHADFATDPTSDFVKCCCCCILSIEAALLILRHWLSLRLWLPWERLGIEALALSSWQQRQQKQNYT